MHPMTSYYFNPSIIIARTIFTAHMDNIYVATRVKSKLIEISNWYKIVFLV